MTISATAARATFFDLIRETQKGHKTVRISHREGTVVLMSEEDYESLVETAELLAIPKFRESIKRAKSQAQKGQTVSWEALKAKQK
jgi:antitoxin YefM